LKLKPVKAEKVIKVLKKLGFQVVRQKGSHVIMKHPDGCVTVVPVHGGRRTREGNIKGNYWRCKDKQRRIFGIIEKSLNF